MTKNTDLRLRKSVMYSVFVRNHTTEGTFRALEEDLDRLQLLGTDIIWLMPIHPIGAVNRKGTLGSPYAIRDYRAINPEYGTMEDFHHLVAAIHERGMKCIIDVVYNHTSPDSVLAQDHPEYFLQDENGQPTRRVADWTDVVDLDYRNRELWNYQIETLRFWAEIVDGFRCDVASMVPVAFWLEARAAVEQVRPGCIWLAESVFPDLTAAMRRIGVRCASDTDLYEAFDITYDYDVWGTFEQYLAGNVQLSEYLALLNYQEMQLPWNYSKLRCLENHDQMRFGARGLPEAAVRSWFAFSYFQRGCTMLYSGEEFAPAHPVSLFDSDSCYADQPMDLQPYLARLASLKHQLPEAGYYCLQARGKDTVVGRYEDEEGTWIGVFSLKGAASQVEVSVPDDIYVDQISGKEILVHNGSVSCTGEPIIWFCPGRCAL